MKQLSKRCAFDCVSRLNNSETETPVDFRISCHKNDTLRQNNPNFTKQFSCSTAVAMHKVYCTCLKQIL